LLSGCGGSDTSATGNNQAAKPSKSATNTAEICQGLAGPKGAFLRGAMEAATAPNSEAKLRTVFNDLAAQFRDSAGKATDPKLKSALEAAARATTAAGASAKPSLEDKQFSAAGSALDAACAAASPTGGGSTGDGKATGASIGAAGSACPLPVTFQLAEKWQPKAVKADAAGVLGDLVKRGPYSVACEIDAKPAGHLGFLRVWTGAPGAGTARQALDTLLAAEKKVTKKTFTETKAGALPAVEVVYEAYSEAMQESRVQHALAVTTPRGVTILHLGGLDSSENAAMLPAFELAKRTLATAA
jgi:hypothetical protein